MGIIINDFEIQIDQPLQIRSSQQEPPGEQQQPMLVQMLSPQDVERIVRRLDERRSRVRAD